MPATPPPLRPWSRVALIAILFLPTPLIAAYPGLAGLFAQDWAGVPAVIWAFCWWVLVKKMPASSTLGMVWPVPSK